MIFEAMMTGILAWQVMMPAVNNAKFTFHIDRDGTIVRMNTQDGTMLRCTADLQCPKDPAPSQDISVDKTEQR